MAIQRLLHSLHIVNACLAAVLAAFSMVTAVPHQATAADLSGDPSTSSTIQLTEDFGHGSYNVYSITMSTQSGATTIVLDQDGEITKSSMPIADYLALWRYLREMDIGNMKDAPKEKPYPGQSLFKYTFQIDSQTNSFSAYGVDFLGDKRYRTIARTILEVAEKYRPRSQK